MSGKVETNHVVVSVSQTLTELHVSGGAETEGLGLPLKLHERGDQSITATPAWKKPSYLATFQLLRDPGELVWGEADLAPDCVNQYFQVGD